MSAYPVYNKETDEALHPPPRDGPRGGGGTSSGVIDDRNREDNVFTRAGYEWLGPGTDIDWNIRHNVQPINDLDAAAKTHDLAYRDIASQYHTGNLSWDEAKDLVRQADHQLVLDALQSGATLSSLAVALGMTGKQLLDFVTGYPSYAGLRDPSDAGVHDEYPPGYFDGIGPGVGVGDPGSYDPRDVPPPVGIPTPGAPGWGMPPDSVGSGHKYDVPYSIIDVSVDQNNNGIPDVLERRRKRKFFVRRHRYALAN